MATFNYPDRSRDLAAALSHGRLRCRQKVCDAFVNSDGSGGSSRPPLVTSAAENQERAKEKVSQGFLCFPACLATR